MAMKRLALTKHQKRILAALLALEQRNDHRWWGRDAIGYLVGAGGYHAVIQKRTMLVLSAESLVLLEVETWPAATRRLVTCNCAAFRWGLTDFGRAIAETISVAWPADAEQRFGWARLYECRHDDTKEGPTTRGDRFEPRSVLFERDDEDEDDPADFWKR